MSRSLAAFIVLLVVNTSPARALQTVSLGARASTLGVGPDVSVSWNDWLIFHGSASLLALRVDLTPVSRLADHLTVGLALPKAFYTAGAAVEGSIFRFGAGVLYKHKDPRLEFVLGDGAGIDIGYGRYTALEVSDLTATLRSDAWAPYVVAGMGKHNAPGLDVFMDIGVAFLTDAELVLVAEGESALLRSLRFRENLGIEQGRFRKDLGNVVHYWPIISFGIRYGLGGR
ncbi:MAG: hypothetical protein OXU69_00325 [Gemmatimonadota bacterium]|nr:hypothetical protein [Gemmatimonadota bacterium]MDE2983123.1 hypothetical protein [Gemmatimonadota bacterium]